MEVSLKLLSAFLLLCLLQQGLEACRLSDISISQAKTGRVIEGTAPEYEAVVSNNCHCPQGNLIVRCFRFSSLEPVDPNAIKPMGGNDWIVNNGRPIIQGSPIKFKYVWLTPHDFALVSSSSNCH